MEIPRELMEKLMEKVNISKRAWYKRIDKRWIDTSYAFDKKVVALSFAVELKIDPRPFSTSKEREKLRVLKSDLEESSPASKSKKTESKFPRSKQVHLLRIDGDLGDVPLNLGPSKMKEGLAMAQIYYLLYIFENSLRKFIIDVMTKNFGKDWWDSKVKSETKKSAKDRELKDKGNRWNSKRGQHPIYYVDVKDYRGIITKNWDVFKDFFPDMNHPMEWVSTRIEEITLSRNIVAHMNPLNADDKKLVELYLKHWLKQIEV